MARSLVIPEVRLPKRLDFALDTKHHLFTDSRRIRESTMTVLQTLPQEISSTLLYLG